jgi:hypothetical protein
VFEKSSFGQSVKHETNSDQIDQRLRSLHTVLVILAHATVPSDPREGAFDYPGQTHNLKRLLTAFDDAKLIALGFDESSELAALVTGIRNDRFDRWKDWAQTAEQTCGCAPI